MHDSLRKDYLMENCITTKDQCQVVKSKKSKKNQQKVPTKGKTYGRKRLRLNPELVFKVDLKNGRNKFNIHVSHSEEIKKEYKEYVEVLKTKIILFSDREDPKRGKAVRAYYKSRYSPQGLTAIADRIRKEVNYKISKGVFISLTYAHILTLDEAWVALDDDISRITNSIKVFAKREAKKRGKPVPDLQYFYVVEAQENGYPHLHIFYADIDRLIDKNDLRWLWGRGHIKIKKRTNTNLGKYMSKYLTKETNGKQSYRIEMILPYVWKYRIRLYGSSQKFHPQRSVSEKRWKLIGFCTFKYNGDPNVPDLITLAQDNNIEVIEFAWHGGGGITIEKDKIKYAPLKVKMYENVPF